MRKELVQVKAKIKKLQERKALIDEELEPLFIREEELENEEIMSICRKNNITIEELIASTRKDKGKRGDSIKPKSEPFKKEEIQPNSQKDETARTQTFGTGEKQEINKNTMMNKEKNDENK